MSKRITPNKPTKSCNIEQLAESRHTSYFVKTLSKENGGLNQVLQPAKPPTYMTAFIVLQNSQFCYCQTKVIVVH